MKVKHWFLILALLIAFGLCGGCNAVTAGLSDTDGDNVANWIDRCDAQPGPGSNLGCPEWTWPSAGTSDTDDTVADTGSEKTVSGGTRDQFTAAQLDKIFGRDNWSVFEDRRDGFAIANLPRNYVVDGKIVCSVDKGPKYGSGETVPGTGGATGWLCGELNLADWKARLEAQKANKLAKPPAKSAKSGDEPKTETGDGEMIVEPDQGADTPICTVDDLNDLRLVGEVKVTDSANGAAIVTFAKPGRFVVPEGWTVDYNSGPKYTSGDVITVVATELTATFWAPGACKPLR